METISITKIHPASYNPRKITPEAFEELKGSLKTLGFILPIIVNKENMTIVAGHQRTKAAKAIGLDNLPVYYVDGISLTEEVWYNQIHNGVEMEPKEPGIFKGELKSGEFYQDIPNSEFEIKEINAMAVHMIGDLVIKHGDSLSCIICDNKVVFGANYVRSCQLLNLPVHCYVLDASKYDLFFYYFTKDYGQYNYESIERQDYVQGLAQMPNKKFKNSVLYNIMLPFLKAENNKDTSVFDFGCGKGYSIAEVRNMGFINSVGIEFFNNNRFGISIEKGQEQIDNLIRHVKAHGKFDYVICDSVLNSVNCMEAHQSVLACLMLFCKIGGKIFFCGRSKESIENVEKQSKVGSRVRMRNFLDKDCFVGSLREGQWYFQKYHTKADVDKIISDMGLEILVNKRNKGMWQVGGIKTKDFDDNTYKAAIDFEFNMKLPNGKRYGRNNDIRELFGYEKI